MSSTDPSETVPADVRALAEKFEDNHIHVHGVASLRNTIEQAILADRKARALSEGRRWRIATRSSYNGSWQFWPAEQWHGEAGRSYAEERFSLMPPSTGRLTMRANVYSDPFSGARVWYCTEEGSKEDGHDEEAVTLAANTFAIGTLLQIWEPDND